MPPPPRAALPCQPPASARRLTGHILARRHVGRQADLRGRPRESGLSAGTAEGAGGGGAQGAELCAVERARELTCCPTCRLAGVQPGMHSSKAFCRSSAHRTGGAAPRALAGARHARGPPPPAQRTDVQDVEVSGDGGHRVAALDDISLAGCCRAAGGQHSRVARVRWGASCGRHTTPIAACAPTHWT